jgi:ribose/xylose/arabinose/galactoside ABC-type transport system permease subunit
MKGSAMKKLFEIILALAVVIGSLLVIACMGAIEQYTPEGIELSQWLAVLIGSIVLTGSSGYLLCKISIEERI